MKQNRTAYYTTIQIFYWLTYALSFSYASMFLLDCGYTNTRIGLIMGLTHATSAIMQPTLSSLFVKLRARLNYCILAAYLAFVLFSVGVKLVPKDGILLSVLLWAVLVLEASVQPSINALPNEFIGTDVRINFGLARGLGSAAYAVICLIMGQLMRVYSPQLIPLFYIATSVILIVLLAFFPTPIRLNRPIKTAGRASFALFKNNRIFLLFCLGLTCASTSHSFIMGFLLQIIRSLGGDSANHGTMNFIAVLLELPAIALFSRVSKKFGMHRVIIAAFCIWVVKNGLTAMATTPSMLYVTAVLQVLSYAIYIPATVEFVTAIMPETALQGLAFTGSFYTVGSLISSLVGGPLIDAIGVHSALCIMIIPSFISAALIIYVMISAKKKYPSVT